MGQRKGPAGRRTNESATAGSWVTAVVFVTVGILAADLILGAPASGHAFADLALSWATPAALAALVSVLLARRSTRRWAWWRYPLTVAPIGLALFAVLSFSGIDLPGIDPGEPDAGRLQADAAKSGQTTHTPAPPTSATPTPTPDPPTPTSAPTPTKEPDATSVLRKPAKLAGLELITEPATERTAERLAAQMRKQVPSSEPLVAFYQDPSAENRLVQLTGSSAILVSPLNELEGGFKAIKNELPITDLHDVPAGPLGGYARCGSADQRPTPDTMIPLTICAWADHSSVMMVTFYNRPLDEESTELFLRIRNGVEAGN